MSLPAPVNNSGGPGVADTAPVAFGKFNTLLAQVGVDEATLATTTATATAAQAAAATAQSTATAAGTTASTAQAAASTALTTATTAQSTATAANTLASTANTTATTANTAATTATANVTALTGTVNTATSNITNLQAQVAGFGISSNVAYLSAQAGVFKTTLAAALAGTSTDSLAGVQAAFYLYANTGITLRLDVPLFINGLADSNGGDYTKSIFVPDNLQLSGDTQGMFIFNHTGQPLFVDAHTTGGIWTNIRHMYIGSPGTTCIGGQFGPGPVGATPGNFFNNTLQPWLTTNRAITFSGASPFWNGPSSFISVMNVRGAVKGRVWRNCTWEVPVGANPANFIFTLCSLCPEYLPGLTVTGGMPQYANNAVTTTAALAAGATSFSLTASFSHTSSHTAQVTFSSGETRVVTMSGITGPFTISPALKYPATTALVIGTDDTPNDLWFDGCTIDGCMMGIVQCGGVKVTNHRSKRYTDLHDGTNGVMTLSAGLSVGATTATLAAWPWQTGTYAATLSSGQIVYLALTQGSTNSGVTLGVPIQLTAQPAGNSTGGQISALFNATSGTYTANLSNGTTVTLTATYLSASCTLSTGYAGTSGTYMVVVSSGNIGCITVTNGNTAATFVATAYTPGTYTASFSSGATRTITISNTGAVTWAALPYASSVLQNTYIIVNYPLFLAATANATCGNMGGILGFSAPPHALYMNYGSGSGQTYRLLIDGFDDASDPSSYVSNYPYRRSTQSGFVNSSKFQADFGVRVLNYVSNRKEGGIGLLSSAGVGLGAMLQNIMVSCDTSILTTDGQTNPLFSPLEFLPSPGYSYQNVTIDGATLTDVALPGPQQYLPFGSSSAAYNNKCVFRNITQVLNDWNTGVYPSVEFTGNNIQVETNIVMQTHSDTATYKGFLFVQTPATNTNSSFDITVSGWRLWPLTFSTTVPAAWAGTGLALAANWPYPSGTYYVNLSDNETRWVNFTNNATTLTWTSSYNQPATTGGVLPATGHTAQGILMQVGNINAWRSRFGFTGAVGTNSNGVITNYRDTTNNYYLTADVNSADEVFSYSMVFTPASGATSFVTTIPLPSGFTVLTCTAYVSGTLGVTGSPTALSIGYPGQQISLIASLGTSNGSGAFMPKSTQYLMPSTQMLTVYFVGGTSPAFGGGGTIYVSVKIAQSFQGS